MPAVDLRGIHFRAYSPQFDDETEEYDPVGPLTADTTPGAIDLSPVYFRAWEENGLDLQE